MADTAKLLPLLPKGFRYPVLTPNAKAISNILSSGSSQYTDEVSVFGAASEGFSQANTNCSIAESLDRAAETTQKALTAGFKVRGSVSCIVGSPFERGVTDPKLVREMAKKMIEFGCYAVSLADTIGVGNPANIRIVLEEVLKEVPLSKLAVRALPSQKFYSRANMRVRMMEIHCHDTFGSGIANTITAVEVSNPVTGEYLRETLNGWCCQRRAFVL
jgi:isopropylmalate/homocitrate/citramalate synthase